MRIAFCGASGTGKTTLAKYISEQYKLPLNPIGSRSVAKEMGFENPYDVDAAGQRAEFQRRLQEKKVAWERATYDFVTDRTTIDELAYTTMHGVQAIGADYYNTALRHVYSYTLLVYCPAAAFLDPGDDPARIKDPTYHRVFDMVVTGAFAAAGRMPDIVLRSPDLQTRKDMLHAMLARMGYAS